MYLLIVGLNHHAASVAIREQVAPTAEEKPDLCRALVDAGVDEAVAVSTCNRTELVLSAADPTAAEAAARTLLRKRVDDGDALDTVLFTLRDTEAVRHLFSVASSLDSLVIGEPHIIGQIREDLDRAVKAGTVRKILDRLFAHAVSLAKSVRRDTSLGRAPVSISSIALDLAGKVFGDIQGKRVLVLGAGEMGRQTAILSAHRGALVTVANRTPERAREIAERVHGEISSWENRFQTMINTDIVVTSTGATSPIIERAQMVRVMHERRNRRIFLIDIAVPRDIEKSVDDLYNLYRYDLDDLTQAAEENAARRRGEIPKVETMIETAVSEFDKWRAECKVIPDITTFRKVVERIRKSEVEAHLRKMGSIDERDRNTIEAMTTAIANKLLHMPTIRLKAAAVDGTDRHHAASLRYLFGLDLEDRPPYDDNDE